MGVAKTHTFGQSVWWFPKSRRQQLLHEGTNFQFRDIVGTVPPFPFLVTEAITRHYCCYSTTQPFFSNHLSSLIQFSRIYSIFRHPFFWLGFTPFADLNYWRELGQNGGTGSGFLLCYRFLMHRWSRRFGDSSYIQTSSQLHWTYLPALHCSDRFHGSGELRDFVLILHVFRCLWIVQH